MLGTEAWAEIDKAAFEQAVDPNGVQRAFMEIAGLKVYSRTGT